LRTRVPQDLDDAHYSRYAQYADCAH
jgi:hypothetical protein